MIKLQILENPALAAGAGRYHFLFSGWLGGGGRSRWHARFKCEAGQKTENGMSHRWLRINFSHAIGLWGGGRSRPENRKWYVPPLASENLILDFPDILQHFFQGKKLKFKIFVDPCQRFNSPCPPFTATTPEYCTSKILEHNNTPSRCEKADEKCWICTVIKRWSSGALEQTLEQWNFGASNFWANIEVKFWKTPCRVHASKKSNMKKTLIHFEKLS